MADETPEDNSNNDEEALLNALGAELGGNPQHESWIMLNETYRGLLAGGFTPSEALALLTNIMWKMMVEGLGE